MKTEDFNYYLPAERIAQTPIEPRHASRLMVLDRKKRNIQHSTFIDIEKFLRPGDAIVVNKTRVIPARLLGFKETGGRAEILLLRNVDELEWEVLVGGKNLQIGSVINFAEQVTAKIITNLGESRRLVRFSKPIHDVMNQIGTMPLPPYIHEPLRDQERYQTIYAATEGSAAAPTAGLHFTEELISKLKCKGIIFVELTLHVGLDTFAPVNERNIEDHQIHREWCEIEPSACESINQIHHSGGKIFAVGTTTVRTLETAADPRYVGFVKPFCGETNLFITPGYTFKIVDALITNFHLPKSTLLMLVSAFAGKEFILESYQKAVLEKYRFYSFGDAMLIL